MPIDRGQDSMIMVYCHAIQQHYSKSPSGISELRKLSQDNSPLVLPDGETLNGSLLWAWIPIFRLAWKFPQPILACGGNNNVGFVAHLFPHGLCLCLLSSIGSIHVQTVGQTRLPWFYFDESNIENVNKLPELG